MTGRLFGTDGIRGRAGESPLDAPNVDRVGRVLGRLFPYPVVIGRDTRESGPWIEEILGRALESEGARVTRAGVMTTPGVSFLTRCRQAALGVVISASHNPFEDNGIKLFNDRGEKFSDEAEASIEDAILADPPAHDLPSRLDRLPPARTATSPHSPIGDDEAWMRADPQCLDEYRTFLCQAAEGTELASLKVVLDTANGAASRIAAETFSALGAQVVPLNAEPDGRNINRLCGAMHPQAMADATREAGADLGAAFDGDADRVVLSDRRGRLLDGDHVLLLLAEHLLHRGELPLRAVVATVMSNMGLEKALERIGVELIRTPVGDRHVWQEMVRGNHPLGGEQSGHIIQRRFSPAGDGLLSAIAVAGLQVRGEADLEKAADRLARFPQVVVNVPVADKPEFAAIPSISEQIHRLERDLRGRGRLLVRYSGTEPLVRIMLEGESGLDLSEMAESLAQRFRREIGHPRVV